MDLPEHLVDVDAIAFDVDGTLAGADHRVSPRTLRALAAVRAAGVEPVIITGRIADAALAILSDAGIDGYVVAAGGAVALDSRDRRPLWTATMDPAETRAVVDFCVGRPLEPSLFTAEAMVVERGSVVHDLLVAANPEATTLAVPAADLPYDRTTKAVVFGEPASLDAVDAELRAAFPRMVRSMPTAFEMSPEGADKWAALAAVLDRLGVSPARTAGVGDGENDLVWLTRIGFPVAMGNALATVKELAHLEIGHHADEAVAELVEGLLAARSARGPA